MKLLRTPWVQSTLAAAMAGWMRLCFSTMRWTVENPEAAQAVWDGKTGVVLCFWHSRISLSPKCWPLDGRAQPVRAMISLSADGEFIAGAVQRLGIPAIRGSSTKRTKEGKLKEKGGTAAFRDVLRWVRGGGCIAITPDGPRGPAEQMAEGAVMTARLTGAPVLMVGLASKPAITLGTWDRAVVPLPFSRGAIVWSDPMSAEGVDDTAAERAIWAERLSAVTRRAEAVVA